MREMREGGRTGGGKKREREGGTRKSRPTPADGMPLSPQMYNEPAIPQVQLSTSSSSTIAVTSRHT